MERITIEGLRDPRFRFETTEKNTTMTVNMTSYYYYPTNCLTVYTICSIIGRYVE